MLCTAPSRPTVPCPLPFIPCPDIPSPFHSMTCYTIPPPFHALPYSLPSMPTPFYALPCPFPFMPYQAPSLSFLPHPLPFMPTLPCLAQPNSAAPCSTLTLLLCIFHPKSLLHSYYISTFTPSSASSLFQTQSPCYELGVTMSRGQIHTIGTSAGAEHMLSRGSSS
jgi:hypothetical protein